MSIVSRIAAFLRGTAGPAEPVSPRRARREDARERHRATGGPAWTPADRRTDTPVPREVQDVAPGTPGSFGSHRTVDDE